MKVFVFVKGIKYVYAQTGTDPKGNFIGHWDLDRDWHLVDNGSVHSVWDFNGNWHLNSDGNGDGNLGGLRTGKCQQDKNKLQHPWCGFQRLPIFWI